MSSGLHLDSDGNGSSTPEIEVAYNRLRTAWDVEGGLTIAARRDVLRALRASLLRNKDAYVESISADFGGRSRHETLLTEVALLLQAVDFAIPKIARWSATARVTFGLPFWPAHGRILRQPRGVVGVIGPSNYPLQLALMPIVAALAAGCRVLLKPSERTPHTAALIRDSLARAIDPAIVAVACGGPDASAAMTRLPLDALLFTGSRDVGREVLRAAAAAFTPVVLELGGKSPVVVDHDADLTAAATSIIAGKLLNAGQTCVAPDYVLVPRSRFDELVAALCNAAMRLYPNLSDYSAILTDAGFARLKRLEAGHRTIPLLAGPVIPPRYSPALVLAPALDSAIMTDEIFGPLLPILAYDRLDEVVRIIRGRPDPLTLYWFGHDPARLDHVVSRTASGSVSVNETVIHAGVQALPFGGIGASGMGRYHGKAGFDAFSHERPVFHQARFTLTKLMRPPYGSRAENILKLLLR